MVQNHNSSSQDLENLKKLLSEVDTLVDQPKELQKRLQSDPCGIKMEVDPCVYQSKISLNKSELINQGIQKLDEAVKNTIKALKSTISGDFKTKRQILLELIQKKAIICFEFDIFEQVH